MQPYSHPFSLWADLWLRSHCRPGAFPPALDMLLQTLSFLLLFYSLLFNPLGLLSDHLSLPF